MKDGNEMDLQFYGEKVINVMLPKNVELEVTYTENAVKGNTSTSAEKDATLETGLKIRVPLFIKVGDVVSVDTESAKFRKRI
jgi:elongation factor P